MTMNTPNNSYNRPARDELPPNAVMLSRDEALKRLWMRINNHPKRSEVWPFTYGLGLLSTSAIIPGIMYTNKIRRLFKLRGFGMLVTYGPCVVVPAMFSIFTQNIAVTNKLILREFNCPTCAQVRGAITQLAVGWAWPGMLTPVMCFMVARKYNPMGIPVMNNFGNLGKFLVKTFRPASGILGFSFVLQALVAVLIVEKQLESSAKLYKDDPSLVKVR